MDLNNKIVLITGAGGGIGRAISIELAHEGAHIVINDMDQTLAEETERIISKRNVKTLISNANIVNRDEVETLFSNINNEFGRIDISRIQLISATGSETGFR